MTIPDDNVTAPKIRTQAQAIRRFSNDKIKTLTKLKVQEYIESFFTETGVNHDLLSAVSPRFLHYNTDKSFDPQTDPTERRLQIARYFAELKNVLPCILIVDGGINVVPGNLGLLGSATISEGVWRGDYPIFRRIPMAIVAAARDVEEADEMAGLISLMFNELRNLACGNHIRGKQDELERWVITLPNGPVDVGALSETEVPGDPIEKIWFTETIIDVFYEDILSIKSEIGVTVDEGSSVAGGHATTGGSLVNESNSQTGPATIPCIVSSDTVSINSQEQIVVQNFQDRYKVILSDSTVATISADLMLSPRAFGKVTIKIIDPNIHIPNCPKEGDTNIIVEKTIEIV